MAGEQGVHEGDWLICVAIACVKIIKNKQRILNLCHLRSWSCGPREGVSWNWKTSSATSIFTPGVDEEDDSVLHSEMARRRSGDLARKIK